MARHPEVLTQLSGDLPEAIYQEMRGLVECAVRAEMDGHFLVYHEITERLLERKSAIEGMYSAVVGVYSEKYEEILEEIVRLVAAGSPQLEGVAAGLFKSLKPGEGTLREIIRVTLKSGLAKIDQEGSLGP